VRTGCVVVRCPANRIDGMTINLPANGHDTDRIGLLGEVANASIG
jgi:hypothetical protein